jgi:hypothetical protein
VKRQVYGAEEAGELFGPGSFIGHGTRVLASRSIVNPDGSARGRPAVGWLRQVRQVTRVDRVKPFLLLAIRAEDAAADNEYDSFLSLSGSARRLRRVRLEQRARPR